MIDKEKARELAWEKLKESSPRLIDQIEIVDDATMNIDYGWVFFYQSKEFLETRNFSSRLAGNAPIIVDSQGKCYVTGTAHPIQYYIDKYRTNS